VGDEEIEEKPWRKRYCLEVDCGVELTANNSELSNDYEKKRLLGFGTEFDVLVCNPCLQSKPDLTKHVCQRCFHMVDHDGRAVLLREDNVVFRDTGIFCKNCDPIGNCKTYPNCDLDVGDGCLWCDPEVALALIME